MLTPMSPRLVSALLCALLSSSSLAQERPNVLLIISDDLAACLGSYGNEVCRTPNLDRLAGEGVRFDAAYCQYPVCAPSRASMMSGLYPETNGVVSNGSTLGSYRAVNPALAGHLSLAGLFREQGYYSARVSKIFHMGVPGGIERGDVGGDDPEAWDFAYDVLGPETLSPGVRTLLTPARRHYGSSVATVQVPEGLEVQQTDHLATSQAIAILENRAGALIEGASNLRRLKPAAPFFLAVGLVRPHVPFVAPARLFERYPVEELSLPSVPTGDLDDVPAPARMQSNVGHYDMSEAQARHALAGYYASVSFMDEQVGRLLEALDRLELREDTIVVFVSDHGFNLGEHGCWQKLSLWDESTRVPLIVSAPGYGDSAGGACASVVELIDLYPTLVELAGLGAQAPSGLEGRSLVPALRDPSTPLAEHAAYTLTSRKGRSLRYGRWRYSLWGEEGEELYDLEADPHEFVNLATSTQHAGSLAAMRARMDELRSRWSED